MMVRQQDIRHPLDAELREVVEHGAGAEVDQDRLVSRPQHMDVARVPEAKDVRGNLDEPTRHVSESNRRSHDVVTIAIRAAVTLDSSRVGQIDLENVTKVFGHESWRWTTSA